jgi:hypothetical protein
LEMEVETSYPTTRHTTQPPGFSFRYPGVARVGGWDLFESNFKILK